MRYLIKKSIVRNYHSHTVRHLKVVVLHKLGQQVNALDLINESLTIGRFNYGCLFVKYLLSTETKETQDTNTLLKEFTTLARNSFNNYLEYADDVVFLKFEEVVF